MTRPGSRPTGASAAADFASIRSPETYLGIRRAENFVSPGGFARGRQRLSASARASRSTNGAYGGRWKVEPQRVRSRQRRAAAIAFRFRARDLHLVLGSATGKPVRFRVLLDGKAPGADHGMDIDAAGNGQVTDQRLYQLIRQKDRRQRTDCSRSTSSIPAPRPTPSPSAS